MAEVIEYDIQGLQTDDITSFSIENEGINMLNDYDSYDDPYDNPYDNPYGDEDSNKAYTYNRFFKKLFKTEESNLDSAAHRRKFLSFITDNTVSYSSDIDKKCVKIFPNGSFVEFYDLPEIFNCDFIYASSTSDLNVQQVTNDIPEPYANVSDSTTWTCSTCGFGYEGVSAPDVCPICKSEGSFGLIKYTCPNCGYIHEGMHPENCPACGQPWINNGNSDIIGYWFQTPEVAENKILCNYDVSFPFQQNDIYGGSFKIRMFTTYDDVYLLKRNGSDVFGEYRLYNYKNDFGKEINNWSCNIINRGSKLIKGDSNYEYLGGDNITYLSVNTSIGYMHFNDLFINEFNNPNFYYLTDNKWWVQYDKNGNVVNRPMYPSEADMNISDMVIFGNKLSEIRITQPVREAEYYIIFDFSNATLLNTDGSTTINVDWELFAEGYSVNIYRYNAAEGELIKDNNTAEGNINVETDLVMPKIDELHKAFRLKYNENYNTAANGVNLAIKIRLSYNGTDEIKYAYFQKPDISNKSYQGCGEIYNTITICPDQEL